MELNIKQTIAVLVVVILAVSCLIPIINETVRQHDADPLTIPIGAHAVDDLDGWTMDVRKASTGFRISSSMYDGTVTRTGVILSSSAVSVWTDTNRIYTMIGGTVTAGTTLSAIVEDGVMTVNDAPAVLGGIVYVPDEFGALGSYAGQTHGLPMAGIGSYAGVTVGSIADELTGNSSDYVLDVSVTEDGDRYGVEYVPGEMEIPEIDPFLPDIEHEDDPEPEPEPGEGGQSGTVGNIAWRFEGSTLYLEGQGAMPTFNNQNPPPWDLLSIESLIIGEGITTIGQAAFRGATNLSYVSIPSTVTEIKPYAFRTCSALTHVDLPDGLQYIRGESFLGSGLTSMVLPESTLSLGLDAIRGCSSLRHLYVPSSTEVSSQTGYHFIRLDGYDMGAVPTGDLYLGSERYVMYQTKTVTVDGAVYRINYIGAELETALNTENVYIPYAVEYNGTDYTVESIGHGAISGSSVRYVVIPQTVESVSSTAITGSGVKEILNLSATEVTASHGEVRTSVPALAVIAEPVTAKGFGAIASMLWIIPLMLVAGAVISIVRGFARARYD